MGEVIPMYSGDFIVCVSKSRADGLADLSEYHLSNYVSSSGATAYSMLKEDVVKQAEAAHHLYWISVNLVLNRQLVSCMTGTLEWFKSVEYFKKVVGSMGGDDGMEAVSFGYIDQFHSIRVELENGVLALSHLAS